MRSQDSFQCQGCCCSSLYTWIRCLCLWKQRVGFSWGWKHPCFVFLICVAIKNITSVKSCKSKEKRRYNGEDILLESYVIDFMMMTSLLYCGCWFIIYDWWIGGDGWMDGGWLPNTFLLLFGRFIITYSTT